MSKEGSTEKSSIVRAYPRHAHVACRLVYEMQALPDDQRSLQVKSLLDHTWWQASAWHQLLGYLFSGGLLVTNMPIPHPGLNSPVAHTPT